jgi:uncharacterized protein
VDQPQEPTRARIVPLFPDHISASGPSRRRAAGLRRDADANDGDAMTDRLLRIEAVTGDLPGEHEGIDHVRSVSLGVSSGAFYPHTPSEEVPFIAAERGLTTIEVMLQTRGEYTLEFAERLRANADYAGVRIHSIHTMEPLHPMLDRYPRRADEGKALFRDGIAVAKTVGATVLVWHGARRKQVESAEGRERFIALTRELAAECGEVGVTLGLENHAISALSQVRDVVDFAKRLGDIGSRREIGFVFDPFQAAEAGANPFMMLAAMGNRIVNVHISDYSETEPGLRHMPPGDGDLPWSALIRAIAGSGYSGPMMIEGPLGQDDTTMTRVREKLDPLIRSVFPFSPDENRDDEDHVLELPEGVRQGIALFNERRFYEQHEVIEHEWHAERGPIRRLYQGILQVGVGFYHALNGNQKGAVLLLTDGVEKLSEFLPSALGIDTGRLVRETQSCLDSILLLGSSHIDAFDRGSIPLIHITGEDDSNTP